MREARSVFRPMALLSVIAAMAWFPAAARAQCPAPLDFTSAPPVTPADLGSPATLETKFDQRAKVALDHSACLGLGFNDSCNRRDFGQAFHHRLFAHLASADPAKREQAHNFLLGVKRSDFGLMGTTAPLGDVCETTLEDVLTFLPDLATNLGRHGEADVAMIGFVTALHKYPMPDNVVRHVLSLIDEDPTIGGVESVSFGLSAATIGGICALVCKEACLGGPIPCGLCLAPCAIALDGESIDAPETENHLNMIYVAQYLANQKRFDLTGETRYDNSRNGYRAKMIGRMRHFVRSDFIEYNSRPYQRYTMFALLALASFATDTAVKDAAKTTLDYVSAKVAVSSNDLIRSTPFRRRDEPNHSCNDLFDKCGDPQSQFYFMLTGLTDVFGPTPPAGFAESFAWVAATDYRLDPLILDLFVDRSHRKFYQFFHYSRVLQFDDFKDSNDELYFGSPSYLLSAGGHAAHYAYTASVPFPINLLPFIGGSHPGSDVDRGATVPTTLMPTGDPARSHDWNNMISFHQKGGENMCVGPNFACGLNPHVPADPEPEYPGRVSTAAVAAAGLDPARWTVFDRKGSAGPYGYFVAVYRQEDFGFLEVYDTFVDGQKLADVSAFMRRVHDNNPGRTFTRDGVNTYKTADGTVLQFTVTARIVTINGVAPIRNRTNGDVINDDGHGIVTITNPGRPGETLTLNATIPPAAPLISVPGPIHFPDTCLGTRSQATLNVCNVASGGDDLFVYNILPKNAQFGATEPSSGYPVTVSHDFCYPFQVQYTPTVHGSLSSSFIVSNSDPEQGSLRIEVTGTAPPPVASTSGALDFGELCIGAERTKTVKVCDTGKCGLTVTGASLQGQCTGLEIVNAPAYPLAISPDFCFDFNVKFKPQTQATPDCALTVTTNDPAHATLTFPITASVGAPDLVLDPPNLSGVYAFPATVSDPTGALGCYADSTLVIRNVGTCPATITGISATAPFSVVAPTLFPVTLPPGEETLKVIGRFKPTADASGPTIPGETLGTLSVSSKYGGAVPDETAGLCGEAVAQSGVRILAVNGTGTPIVGLDTLTLASKGVHDPSPISLRLKNVSPAAATVCGNPIRFHLDRENLPPTSTTGVNSKSSYSVSVKEGNKQVTQSFTLGQCEFKPFVIKLQ